MAFEDNKYRKDGSKFQITILKRIVKILEKRGHKVKWESRIGTNDDFKGIDYFLIFDESTPFLNKCKISVDVKFEKTFTLISDEGYYVLNNSISDLIIFNPPGSNAGNTYWITTHKLKELIEKFPPELESLYSTSKFFWIEEWKEKYDLHKYFVIEEVVE